MARFSEMVDRKAEEIKAPPLVPAGEYLLMGKKHPETAEIRVGDGTTYERVTFELVVVEPIEVDEDALSEFGKVQGQNVRKQFMFNTNPEEERSQEMTLNAIKRFLESCGCFEDGMTLAEGMAAFPNSTCRAEITHRPDKNDNERFYLEVGRTYRAE